MNLLQNFIILGLIASRYHNIHSRIRLHRECGDLVTLNLNLEMMLRKVLLKNLHILCILYINRFWKDPALLFIKSLEFFFM